MKHAARIALAALVVLMGGCTSLQEWLRNGFKVGPSFQEPPAPLASKWIDSEGLPGSAADGTWWKIFNDPNLNSLIQSAYQDNLDLQIAMARVLQAQAQRNIAAGNLFPQTQQAQGNYAHVQLSSNFNVFSGPQGFGGPLTLPTIFNVWSTGFNASWEIDFWGRIRRQIESANAELDASVENYRGVLVTLLADVASNYVQACTFQQRIAYARKNAELQKSSLDIAQIRHREGRAGEADVRQAELIVAQTEATIPPLVLGLRQANDQLCVLLGLPPRDLVHELSKAPIPTAPPEAAIGIPAELLVRRPDVRRALQEAAAQSAQIGVAEADFYPRIAVTGFIGYASDDIRRLFEESSFTGLIMPDFTWKILNYGRILNNVRLQDARFRERVLAYQETVLTAGREVEDALAGFVEYQKQARNLEKAAQAAERTVELVTIQWREGAVDYNRLYTTQSQLVTQEDQLAATRGNIVLSLIAAYRALGGGWQAFESGAHSP